MSANAWGSLLLVAVGSAVVGRTLYEARSSASNPEYSSWAVRLRFLLLGFGIILAGLGVFWTGVGDYALLLMVLSIVWQLLLLLSTVAAPKLAARLWIHQYDVALALGTGRVPTMIESEREARLMGYGLLALLALLILGYWLVTRWLGIFLLPLAFLVLLIIGAFIAFWPGYIQAHNPFHPKRLAH